VKIGLIEVEMDVESGAMRRGAVRGEPDVDPGGVGGCSDVGVEVGVDVVGSEVDVGVEVGTLGSEPAAGLSGIG
jgi:hypothetical protein